MGRSLFLVAVVVVVASCSSSVNPNLLSDAQEAQLVEVCATGEGVGDAFGAEFQPGGVNKVDLVRYESGGQLDTAEDIAAPGNSSDRQRARLRELNGTPAELSLVVCAEIVDETVGELCDFGDGFSVQWTDRVYSMTVRNLKTGAALAPASDSAAVGECSSSLIFSEDEPNITFTAAPDVGDRLSLLGPFTVFESE